MISDLKPLHDNAKRFSAIVAHFAALNVVSIRDFFLFMDPTNPECVNRVFVERSGLPVHMDLVYFLDAVAEAKSINVLCLADGPLPKRYVAVIKRYFAEHNL